MRDFMIEPVADPVAEARRYVENAKKLLRENGKLDLETQLYQKSTCDDGFRVAEEIIKRCETLLR